MHTPTTQMRAHAHPSQRPLKNPPSLLMYFKPLSASVLAVQLWISLLTLLEKELCVYVCACLYVCTRMYTCTYLSVHMFLCLCAHVSVQICVCACLYVHAH